VGYTCGVLRICKRHQPGAICGLTSAICHVNQLHLGGRPPRSDEGQTVSEGIIERAAARGESQGRFILA
jgi:hypothetical protein